MVPAIMDQIWQKNGGQKNGGIICRAAIFCPRFFCLKISERLGHVKREFLVRMDEK
jgi:hypothetical protein